MKLKKFREAAGLTQEQLAARSGVDDTVISRLERGIHKSAGFTTIVRLAFALNVEPLALHPVRRLRPVIKRSRGLASTARLQEDAHVS